MAVFDPFLLAALVHEEFLALAAMEIGLQEFLTYLTCFFNKFFIEIAITRN